MRLRLVQTQTTPDKAKNLDKVAQILGELAPEDTPPLVVFPEMYMALPTEEAPLHEQAEPLDGPFAAALGRAAAQHGVHLACGMWETSDDPRRVYNTLVIFGPDGRLAASYRKLHLFDALSVRESDRMVPGEGRPPVLTIDGVRVGFGICYDLRFPEMFRHFADEEVDLVVVPSAWYAGPFKEDHWLTLLRARAIENTAYVAGANLTGPAFCGRSSVFDPFGVPLAAAGEGDAVVRADVNTDRVREVRAKLPSLRHRRRETFEGQPEGVR